MIEFKEDTSVGYPHRTNLNAKLSDATIAFAVDFSTGGEKLTKIACEQNNKPIFQLQVNDRCRLDKKCTEKLEEIITCLNENNLTKINIAGNGIFTFHKHKITQERIDELVYNVLFHLKGNGCTFTEIRSGGQSGADEAGLKAGEKLGVKTICLCPKKWRYRNINNTDVYSEREFKKRFGIEL